MTPDPTGIDGTEVGRRLDQVRDRIAEAGGDPLGVLLACHRVADERAGLRRSGPVGPDRRQQ